MALSNGPRHRSSRSARHLLELRTAERVVEVQWAGVGRGDERQVDLGLLLDRQLDLGVLGGFLESLHGHVVFGQVDAMVVLERGGHPLDDCFVPVVATKFGVATGGLHFEHAVADLEYRHIERAATEVEYQDRLVGVLVEAIGQCSSGWLVDDAQDFEAGDLAGFLGGGALGIIEVGRNRDNRLGDRLRPDRPRRLA